MLPVVCFKKTHSHFSFCICLINIIVDLLLILSVLADKAIMVSSYYFIFTENDGCHPWLLCCQWWWQGWVGRYRCHPEGLLLDDLPPWISPPTQEVTSFHLNFLYPRGSTMMTTAYIDIFVVFLVFLQLVIKLYFWLLKGSCYYFYRSY